MTSFHEKNLDDTISGSKKADFISGNDGDDTIYGLSGHDELRGGDGDDTLFGDSGNDELNGNAGDDELQGGSGKDILKGGSGRDDIEGGGEDDHLLGGSGNDTLNGGLANDDEINGGGDNDSLTGDNGDDNLSDSGGNILFNGYSGSFGAHIIDDASGTDTLNLSSFLLNAASFTATDSSDAGLEVDGLFIDFGSGNTITIMDYFDNSNADDNLSAAGSGIIETLVFSDDANVDFSQVQGLIA